MICTTTDQPPDSQLMICTLSTLLIIIVQPSEVKLLRKISEPIINSLIQSYNPIIWQLQTCSWHSIARESSSSAASSKYDSQITTGFDQSRIQNPAYLHLHTLTIFRLSIPMTMILVLHFTKNPNFKFQISTNRTSSPWLTRESAYSDSHEPLVLYHVCVRCTQRGWLPRVIIALGNMYRQGLAPSSRKIVWVNLSINELFFGQKNWTAG